MNQFLWVKVRIFLIYLYYVCPESTVVKNVKIKFTISDINCPALNPPVNGRVSGDSPQCPTEYGSLCEINVTMVMNSQEVDFFGVLHCLERLKDTGTVMMLDVKVRTNISCR